VGHTEVSVVSRDIGDARCRITVLKPKRALLVTSEMAGMIQNHQSMQPAPVVVSRISCRPNPLTWLLLALRPAAFHFNSIGSSSSYFLNFDSASENNKEWNIFDPKLARYSAPGDPLQSEHC
jgi:hypothetical protein